MVWILPFQTFFGPGRLIHFMDFPILDQSATAWYCAPPL